MRRLNVKINVLTGILLAGVRMVVGAVGYARTTPRQESSSSTSTTSSIAMGAQATDQDIQLLRQDIRAKKQELITENLPLTESEATKFWPIYRHYTSDLVEINNEKFRLIKEYSAMWGNMSDQDALIYIRRWLEVDQKVQALRLSYVPTVSQVLPGKKAATFFQLDRRISMMIDVQLASQIPLAVRKN
jgi:hypothetical protein